MIMIHAHVQVGPGNRQQWLDLTEGTVEANRAAPGNQMYLYVADLFDPDSFHVFQMWDDQATLDAHIAEPHHQERLKALEAIGGRWTSVTHYDISDVRKKR